VAKYSIQILPSVTRHDFSKLPKTEVGRIMARIKLLGDDPRPSWSKKLSGREEYRARRGSYRILYVIEVNYIDIDSDIKELRILLDE
jgi:mRNA interferase RelE/StbE